jgi:hypothetical protein
MAGVAVGVDNEIGEQIRLARLAGDINLLDAPSPLSVSPMIQRTVPPAVTGPEPTRCSPFSRALSGAG